MKPKFASLKSASRPPRARRISKPRTSTLPASAERMAPMMLMSVVSYQLGIDAGIKITLFPMIIIAWTLERMSLIWEEEGKRNAITQVAGSVFVAVCAYHFMKVSQIQYWAFYFPEMLLILLAGILLIGRYTGYRLSELIRFKSFSNA